MKLFISYSRDDKLYVYELADRLRDDGNHYVWIDKAALVGGDSWWDAILNGVEGCECVITVLSPRALGSIYCDGELRYAQALNKPILPLMLKEVDIPAYLSAIQAENITEISLDRTYGRCERALGQIELRRERGLYPAPNPAPKRPPVPVLKPGQESEHVFEVYANAIETLEKDVTLAKKLLQQVVTADPGGLGIPATEHLAEIAFEQDRQTAYLAIARLAGNPTLRRDASKAWKAFIAKYGIAYDPNNYTQLLIDEPMKLQDPPAQPVSPRPSPKPAQPRPPTDQDRLLAIMLDPNRLPTERAEAGREINKFGDPRPGVLDFNFKVGEYWCEVSAGEFIYQDGEKKTLPKFYIAKYPVTYWQYQQFLNDKSNGYANAQWWKSLHADGLKQQKEGPGDQKWKLDNHPRERVSWYDAMAYCKWLSAKLRYEVTLPAEEQWEKAARGTDGPEYPWGNGYKEGFANIDETYKSDTTKPVGPNYLKTTTAVGIYPQGESDYHVLDMSGNVWEWMLNESDSKSSNNITNNQARSLRGGSWRDLSDYAHAAYRFNFIPYYRYFGFGFRVVCSAAVP